MADPNNYDPYEMYAGDQSSATDMARARAHALSNDKLLGLVMSMTQNQAFRDTGQSLLKGSEEGTKQLGDLGLGRTRFGPQDALGGQTPDAYEAITKRQMVPKFISGQPFSPIFNAHSGQVVFNPQQQFDLSPTAMDQQVERYHLTGELPPTGGRGVAGMMLQRKIMNAAAEKYPTQNLALSKSSNAADTAALKDLTDLHEKIGAFEETAGKNLDLFLNNAKGVMNTGLPFLNKPLRSLDQNILGSPQMSAFNASRIVAANEIARVTKDPKLSGALSDDARHSIDTLLSADATPQQLYAAAQVLRLDMSNRADSTAHRLDIIRSRIAKGVQTPDSTTTPGPGPKRKVFDPATGTLK